MLGRNCGCSWWFEVRRDWPRVTLNKYTRTSQEGAGKLRLPPNHPWLISWQIQGDFLSTLPTNPCSFPQLTPNSHHPHEPTEGDGIGEAQTGQARQMEHRYTILPLRQTVISNKCTYIHGKAWTHAQIWLHTAPQIRLLQLWQKVLLSGLHLRQHTRPVVTHCEGSWVNKNSIITVWKWKVEECELLDFQHL